jgi:hypothetical protein
MPSRANREPGRAQQAITVRRSAFPNAAPPADKSPATRFAPFPRSGSARSTRSTPMTTPKHPARPLARRRARRQTRRLCGFETEASSTGQEGVEDGLAGEMLSLGDHRRRVPPRRARRCRPPSGRHGRWYWRRRLRTSAPRRVRPGGSGPRPRRAGRRARGSARGSTRSCGCPDRRSFPCAADRSGSLRQHDRSRSTKRAHTLVSRPPSTYWP